MAAKIRMVRLVLLLAGALAQEAAHPETQWVGRNQTAEMPCCPEFNQGAFGMYKICILCDDRDENI